MCRRMFMVAYDVGKHGLENLLKHYSEHGAVPRTHGNTGKKPSKSLRFEEIKFAVQFIANYADEFGLPQPAAPRGRDDTPPIYLPSSKTKMDVHDTYSRSCEEASVRVISLSTFRKLWINCLPYIKIATPRDDVCATCEKVRKEIMGAVTEESKLEAAAKMTEHVVIAQQERDLYNQCIKQAKQGQLTHFTFDFSQNVSLPHHSRQMGPLFFRHHKKDSDFWVRIDSRPQQLNFLIDEHESIGKDGSQTHGPNAVISMVDWALQTHGSEDRSCTLHANNCPGMIICQHHVQNSS